MDFIDLLYQILYYFPYYIMLVIIPMFIRIVIERAIGINPKMFESKIYMNITYETAFKSLVVSALYYPLFEELIFRGLPYYFFGYMGVIIGSSVWVVMHPAWQLQYLSSLPFRKKFLFTITSSSYYIANAIFYSLIWVNNAGLTAIIYHMGHNAWLILADIMKEIELPMPWKRYKYIKPLPTPSIQKQPSLSTHFVMRKTTRSLSDEVKKAKLMFVKQKNKNRE